MKSKSKRQGKTVVIYPAEAEDILRAKPRTVRRLFQKIREACGRKSNRFITVTDFCLFTGIAESIVHKFIS